MSNSFQYKARTFDGEKKSGVIQAESHSKAAALLAEKDLIPIDIKPTSNLSKPGFFGFMKRRLYEDLILFTRNLSTLYQAGIPLLRALEIIKIGPANSFFNRVLQSIRNSVQAGIPLSTAMEAYPSIFPKIYISAITAGELSGKLDLILDSLAEMLEMEMDLTRQLKSSLRYPIIVVLAISLAFIVLVTFVIPRFVGFYSQAGAELPLPTKFLIWVNYAITNYWYFVIGGLALIGGIIYKIYSTPEGRLYFDTRFLQLPVFGELIIKGSIARFSNILKILYQSGIPLVSALDILSGVVKNMRLSNEIEFLSDSFREGRGLDPNDPELKYFPDMALQLMNVGLESGSLDTMLDQVARHYAKDVSYTSRQIVAILEPILTVILGGFVLIVALAIFLPMWNLIQAFRS